MVGEQEKKLLDKLVVHVFQANTLQVENDRDAVYVVFGTQFVDFFEHVGQKSVQSFHFSFVGIVVLDLYVEHWSGHSKQEPKMESFASIGSSYL